MKLYSLFLLLILTSCISNLKQEEIGSHKSVIALGLKASSSHNAQPWKIVRVSENEYKIFSVKERWLPEVDPENRELMISIGALIGNLELSAKAYGYRCDFSIVAEDPYSEEIAVFTLEGNGEEINSRMINVISSIKTSKGKYSTREIPNILATLDDSSIFYSRNTSEYNYLYDSTIEANISQANRDSVQRELANYISFSLKDDERGYGINPQMMEVPIIMHPFWYLFFDKESVMSESFRNEAVKKIKLQMDNSAGFILMTTGDSSVQELIRCGIDYQKLLYRTRKEGIEVQPISQVLEEVPWKNRISSQLGIDREVQMILRVGLSRDKSVDYSTDAITSASLNLPFEYATEGI